MERPDNIMHLYGTQSIAWRYLFEAEVQMRTISSLLCIGKRLPAWSIDLQCMCSSGNHFRYVVW